MDLSIGFVATTPRDVRSKRARTGRGILDRGSGHFLTHGYQGTTVSAVAVDAGVSVETVYKAFANKAGLLKAVFDVTLAGDDEPVPLMDREEIRRNQAEPDPRKKLRMYAEFYAERAARAVRSKCSLATPQQATQLPRPSGRR